MACVSRYYLLRAYYYRRLSINKISMIGSRCGIHILKSGEMICDGRIIVNDDVMIYTKGKLTIGAFFGINRYSRIVAHEKISIGHHVTIGQMVSILDHDHAYLMVNGDLTLDDYNCSPITIGNNVWIGDKVTILKGVEVGNNVIIGANSLINKKVPDNCIVGGNPFKIIKILSVKG